MSKVNKNIFGHIAEELQENLMDEAEAVESYQKLLNEIDGCLTCDYMFEKFDSELNKRVPTSTATADKKLLKLMAEEVKNIIADELKHQKTISILYEASTGLKAKEEK